MSKVYTKVRTLRAKVQRGESRQRRGRLEAALTAGIPVPVVPAGSVKDRHALAHVLGGSIRDAGFPIYSARADRFSDGTADGADTGGAWPKGESKSAGIGNSCASTVRTYVRSYGAEAFASTAKVWPNVRFASVDADTDEVMLVWVD